MYEKELKTAISAVKRSEKTFRKYFGTKTKVEEKDGNWRNLVSYADKKIESEIKAGLRRVFPSHGFICEEGGRINAEAEYVWTIDPIDGTTNYLRGVPDCTIAVSLLQDQKPVLGIVFAPLLGRLYTAAAGQGARLNGKKISVAKSKNPARAFGGIAWGKDLEFAPWIFSKVIKETRTLRIAGSTALALAQVADGSFDFFCGKKIPDIWDSAPGQLLVEEAGGSFLVSRRQKVQIAGNASIARKLQKIIV